MENTTHDIAAPPEKAASRRQRAFDAAGRAGRASRADLRAAAILFLAAFLTGPIYTGTWGEKPEFWQQVFAPSVMAACGHGFNNPDLREIPALEDFLYLRAPDFDCAGIPAGVTILPRDTSGMTYDEIQAFHPLPQFPGWTQWQQFHRYLLLSVALCFWLFGVAWQSLLPLYGLLYGAANALAYGVFRLAMGRGLACAFAVMLMASPLHLQQLPQLRDYSKAPFFFLLILALGWLLKRPRPLKFALPIAGVAGLAGGLGLGFRQDVSIAAAVFCALVLAFWPAPLKASWARRLAVVITFCAAFILTGAPILNVLSRVNNSTHDTIIGFTQYCDQRLGVGAPLYDFGDPFKDEYVRAMIMRHAQQAGQPPTLFRHYSPEYDAAGRAWFRDMVRLFPADLLIRGYASVLRTVDELQISRATSAPRGVTNQFLVRLFQWRQAALDALPGGGRYHVAAMLLLIAAASLRLGFAALFGMLVLAGYPALRFSERHAFHMEFIALLAAGFLLHIAWRAARRAWAGRQNASFAALAHKAKPLAARAALFALIAPALLLAPLYAARAWQAGHVRALLHSYATADRVPLETVVSPAGDGAALILFPGLNLEIPPDRHVLVKVLVLAFRPGDTPIPLNARFQADHPNFQFDRWMYVPDQPEDTGLTHVYYPLYRVEECAFTGIALPDTALDRLESVSALTETPDAPILLNAVLPPNWEAASPYQALTR